MKERETDLCAAAVFGAAAGLCVYMWGGLYAGAAALLLCSLTAFAAGRFGRIWGFVPACAGIAAALVFHERFLAECALCADNAEYLYALGHSALYVPVADTADTAFLVLLAFCGIVCGLYTAFGVRITTALMTVSCVSAGIFLGTKALPMCALAALTAAAFCFGTKNRRALALIAATVVIALPAAFVRLPETRPEGEVTASGGLPLYLAESYEQPHCTKAQYARNSAIFKTLSDNGFDPRLQSAYFLEAAGADLPADTVTAEGGLIPQNVCAGEVSHRNMQSFSGESFTVCRQLPENIFRLMTELHEGDYLDCEGLYREYVYNAYGSLTAEEQQLMENTFSVDGSLPLDKKLAAVKAAIDSKLTVGEGAGSVNDIVSRGKADSEGYARLTVCLAKSCGIAAREVRGTYFGTMPQSGHAKLSDGEYRVWAEVYIDGAGWTAFETHPEYSGCSPLLPEGTVSEGAKSDTEAAERYIYASAPPRTAAEIRTEDTPKKPDIMWLCYPAGALVFIMIAGRIRAGIRLAKRRSSSYDIALTATHFQGRQLTELVLGVHDISPEELAGKAGGLLGARLSASERAYERMRFSDTKPDKAACEAAAKFYAEALRASKKQGFFKSLKRRIAGLY